jgi:hypothetical protein
MSPQVSNTITEEERDSAIARLQSSRDLLIDAIGEVSPTQASFRTAPERWSILELVEHLAVSEDALVGIVRHSLETPPKPDLIAEARKKDRWFGVTALPPSGAKHTAPHAMHPKERFQTVAEAFAAFEEARARTIAYARETQDDLRSHFHLHPEAGQMDGYQWLVANAIHAETHARHIAAVKADPNYPRVD